MSEYFLEPKSLGRVKVELDLCIIKSNYATKTDLKNETGIDTFAKYLLLKKLI